uniref:GG11746 n=3 Tax=Drosophila erecta TaxID=7220 RepID=B3P599_DROER
MNMMAMTDVMSKYQQQQQQQQQQQHRQQQHATQKGLEGLLLTNTNTSNNNSNNSSSSSSSISNLIISHNSASNTGNKMQPAWGQSDAISALWGCSSSSSGCSSGSGSQPSLSPTASSSGGNDGSKMMLWAAQSSPQNAAALRDSGFKELQRQQQQQQQQLQQQQQQVQQQVPQQLPHAASPTASLTSSSSSSNGWSASHYGKANIWELPGSAGQRTPASSHDIFTDLLGSLSISPDIKADASDVSSNSSSSAGELLEAANIWRFPEYASQLYNEEPTGGGAAACMQLFNDYLNMN